MKPDKTCKKWCVTVGLAKDGSNSPMLGEVCYKERKTGHYGPLETHDYDTKAEADIGLSQFIVCNPNLASSYHYEVVENTLSQTPVKVGNFTINIQHPIAVTSVAQKVQEILDGMKDLSKPLFKSSAALSDSTPLTNDATCKTCKNDRLSTSEKSCWKCGNLC